jgi:DNA-binding transcriptional LysR family regulator
MKKQPDLNYLKYFYYVSKLEGFTKAATYLKVQQPVVSRAVKLLEKELGCFLIERQKKKLILTAEGKKVFAQCELIFSTLDNITDQLSHENEKEEYVFSFVSSDSLSYGILEKMLSKLRKDFPNVIFQHQSGSIKNFLDEISDGNIELGFFFNVPKLPAGLVKSKLMGMDFHYVVKKEEKTNKKTMNSFIATISTTHETTDELPLFKRYREINKQANVSLISDSSMTRKSMVMNGLGVTILPHFLIKNELQKGSLVTLGKAEKLALYIVERQGSYRTKLKTHLISLVKEIAGE